MARPPGARASVPCSPVLFSCFFSPPSSCFIRSLSRIVSAPARRENGVSHQLLLRPGLVFSSSFPCPFASASRDLAWHFCFCFFSWLLSLLRSASNFLILSQTPPTADPSQRPSFQFPIFLFFHMPQLEISNSFFWCSFSFQLASCPQRTQACAGDSGVQVIVAGTRSSSLISSLDAPPIDAAITGCL